MPKNAIVVGMPRSGTSMTASIFARIGYYCADNDNSELRAGDQNNPFGYWEAASLIQSNAEVFSAVGFNHDNTWLYDAIAEHQAQAIEGLEKSPDHQELIHDFDQNSPWMWKDPRLCYTLSYWWPLCDKANTGVILIKRDPEEIYNSFVRVKWRNLTPADKRDTYDRINHHISTAEKTIRDLNIPHVIVHYSDFKRSPEQTASKIASFFDVKLTTQDLNFSEHLNHSSTRGRFATYIDLTIDCLPNTWLPHIKSLVPNWVMKKLYPERYL